MKGYIFKKFEELKNLYRKANAAEVLKRYKDTLDQTWKKTFFMNSDNLGMQIWQKKCINYDKFEIVTKQRKSNI